MNAKELRIGNYVLYPKYWQDRPIFVTGVSIVDRKNDHTGIYEEFIYLINNSMNEADLYSFVDYKNGVVDPKEIEPIPINDVSLKLFSINNRPDIKLVKNLFGSYNFDIAIQGSDSPWLTLRQVEYIHQLQNLYFALTGDELTINT